MKIASPSRQQSLGAVRIVLAGALLGIVLFRGSSNPFVFVPPYIGLAPPLELASCVAVGLAVCCAVSTCWGCVKRRWSEGSAGSKAKAVLAVVLCGYASYLACALFALLLHYFLGFGNAVSAAYVAAVIAAVAAAIVLRAAFSRT